MVALPEPRPETPRQAEKRQAIENVQRSLLGRQLMADELTPAGLAARQREGLETLKGVGVGLPAGLLGLPADLLALLFRDAPSLLNKLVTGEPLDIEERGQFAKAFDAFQKVAGAEAIGRRMGFGEDMDAESEGGDAASRAGMNPFRQGMLFGEFIADPFLAVKGVGALLKAGSRTDTPATRSTDLVPVGAPDTPTTTVPGLPEEVAQQPTRLQATGDITDIPRENIPDVGEILDFSRPDADPALGEMELFQFEGDMIHTATGTRIPAGSTVRGDITDFESAGGRDASLVNRTEVTQRMATPEETAAVMRGEDPAEVAPTDEGIATLPAAEDVIDVEPVAQAALTPIRTEGQQQLRQQAFPITEDMDVFEPSGMSELGSNYFGIGRDYSTTVPGSGQRGIATTFDFGNSNPRTIQRQGEVADYSPSFQTLDRLPDRDYTKQQIIEFLEAQPEAAMRDLKGSGFIEYLRSPYAPETYDSVADLRRDYIIHTPQLRVKTVSNNDIAEQQAKLEVDPNSVKPSELLPYSSINDRDSKLPYSGQQTFFEEGTDQAPFDRGVIILNNPNTSRVIGQQLRAPDGHNYFGGSAGVPGYIAHSRYSVVLGPTGKKIAVMEETQGNTVSSAARGQRISATPLEKARATYLNRNENYKRHSEIEDSVSSNRRLLQDAREAFEKKATGELQNYSEVYVTKGMLDDRPGTIMPNPFYNMLFDAFQKDLRNAEGVFDIGQRNETTIFRAPAYGDNLASVLRRNTTPEQQQLIVETLDSNQIPSNKMLDQAGDTREPEIATFENLAGETNMMYIIRNNMRYLKDQGTLDDRGKQLLELIDLDSPANKDLQIRAVFEGDALEKYIDKLEDAGTAKYREARQEIEQEFSAEEFDEMTLAHESVQEGRMVPGQPFATTRDFDEYMPRLTLQELIRRGDIDEVVFPSPDALMNVGGRSGFRGGPEEAGFRNTYGKGVKKGLNKIKAENPDFKIETIENYTPGGDPTDNVTLIGSSTVINLRDPAVRSVFEGRLIRRAKGGEVDLRPRKMIHSGIGAMAKEIM